MGVLGYIWVISRKNIFRVGDHLPDAQGAEKSGHFLGVLSIYRLAFVI